MATIIVNKKTKAGKTLLELARILSENSKGITIKENSYTSSYKVEFVEEIKERYAKIKNGETKTEEINPKDVWGSLGLK